MSRPIVAGEVRAAMARANVTQQALANSLGVSAGTLSERLAGRRPFTTDELEQVGYALGVDPFSFFSARVDDDVKALTA